MNDPALNNLLKWGITNSDVSRNDPSAAPPQPMSEVDRTALQQIMSGITGPSDAQLMHQALQVVEHPEATTEDKYIAFENFELLIENIDNANNMENKEMWSRLVKQLENEDATIRWWAAWCCGTAVQNNIRSQERVSENTSTNAREATLTNHSYSYSVPFLPSSVWRPQIAT